jgi:uncharacterized protein (DUF3820 family)
MKMPFGHYKDQDIEEVPDSYLQWLWGQKPTGEIKEHLREELLRREKLQNEGRIVGKTTKLAKDVFMDRLASLIQQVPDEFLSGDWQLKTPMGKFSIRIRKNV